MLRYYSENGPEHYVPIQKKLIEQAYQMLAEGGELLYSTCTFSVKENEEVIAGCWMRIRIWKCRKLPRVTKGLRREYP